MNKKEAFKMFEEFVKNHPAKFKYKFTPSELRTIEIFFINVRLKEGNTEGLSYKAIVKEVHDDYIREYNKRNNVEPEPEPTPELEVKPKSASRKKKE